MPFEDELLDILRRIWTKVQDLPQASPLEVGAFTVLILFFATVFLMFVLSCIHCCCGNSKYQASRVQPLQP